ncbi:MAG: class I SAM-dependent methyltransferase [Candidatus Niyogibacteria bacterium]|nr:class I SAM-dependent methyltransferase [Candidatus Niyogibacteria bacterium]
MEWTLFVPRGERPRTQRQFNLYNYYQFIHRLIKGKGYRTGIEIGCGRGTLALFLHKYDGIAVTLLDSAARAIALAKKNFDAFEGKGEFVVADAAHTRLVGGQYDVAVSIGLLEHVPDYRAVLAETYRIMRPGGVLVTLNLPRKFSLQKLNDVYKFFLRPFLPKKKLQKDYYRNHDKPEQYAHAAQEAGFRGCYYFQANPFPIWTPIPAFLEQPIALLYRGILRLRGFWMKEPMKTNRFFSHGHFLVCLR